MESIEVGAASCIERSDELRSVCGGVNTVKKMDWNRSKNIIKNMLSIVAAFNARLDNLEKSGSVDISGRPWLI